MRMRHWILIAGLVAGLGCSDGGADDACGMDNSFPAICPGGAIEGDYEIMNAADAEAIACCMTVTGTLDIAGSRSCVDDTSLTSVSLAQLTTTGNLTVGSQGGCTHGETPTALTSLDFPALISGSIRIENSPVLRSLNLPMLTSGGVLVLGSTALTSLSLPMLTSSDGGFGVFGSTTLTSFSVPLLTTVTGQFGIYRNAAFETSLAQAVRDQLTAAPLTTLICGNKSGTACP